MSENVITIEETATIEQAARLMLQKHVNSLLVVKNKLPIATVGKKEIIQSIVKESSRRTKLRSIMSKDFLTVDPTTSYHYIEQKMRLDSVRRCPVVENNTLVGIITESDILNTARDFTKNQQIKQDITLVVFGLVTAFFLFAFSPLGKSIFAM